MKRALFLLAIVSTLTAPAYSQDMGNGVGAPGFGIKHGHTIEADRAKFEERASKEKLYAEARNRAWTISRPTPNPYTPYSTAWAHEESRRDDLYAAEVSARYAAIQRARMEAAIQQDIDRRANAAPFSKDYAEQLRRYNPSN